MCNTENISAETNGGNNSTNRNTAINDVSTFNIFNSCILRRAWSAENILASSYQPWSTGEPIFYVNWNYPPYYSAPPVGYHWGNGYHCPTYPVTNAFYPNGLVNFAGNSVHTVQENYFFHGVGPPPQPAPFSLFSSQSDGNMQRREYYVRRNNNGANISDNVSVNPQVLKVLSKRYWENVKKKRKSSKPGVEFTVMSYNVLAQDLINNHFYLYKNHNPRSLHWDKRWKNLFDEISKLLPDIMCLQEVQESHLTGFYSKLESLGYKGIYKKKTGERCDGCAIYYKPDKFKLIEYETVEYYQPRVESDVLNRDNVAIVAKFSPMISSHAQFIVATTHLLYNPRRQDVRLAQTQLLLAEIERLGFHHKPGEKDSSYCPIIITGDFNSTPDSAVYELITKGVLRYDNLSARRLDDSTSIGRHGNVLVPRDLEITDKCQHVRLVHKRQRNQTISRTEEVALIKLYNSEKRVRKISSEVIHNRESFSSGTLSHLFAFNSVYTHGDLDNVEGTTYQDAWISVDYIFYSGKKRREGDIKESKLKLVSRYRVPRKNELGSIKIPNSLMGSDHLSLVAKFRLKI